MLMRINHDPVRTHRSAAPVTPPLITTSLLMRVRSASSTNSLVFMVMLSAASMTIDLMPLTYQRPVAGSYSNQPPSGMFCHAGVRRRRRWCELIRIDSGSAKAVSRLPPRLSSTTCSPSDGRHHVRAFPARSVSQLIQLVSRSPVFTRQSQFSCLLR